MSISTDAVVSTIEHLIRGSVESRTWNAPKAVITPPDGRYMMATLSASDDPPYLAVKSLVLNPKNKDRGLSDINSLVTLLDSDTGLPLAVIGKTPCASRLVRDRIRRLRRSGTQSPAGFR